MDETGQPGGATPGINGNGRHHSEQHTRQNGTWVSSEPAWTGADAVLEAGFEPVVPIWRRPVDPPPVGLAAQPGGAPRDNGYHPADVEHIRGDLLPAVPDGTPVARGSEGDTGGYGLAGPAGPVPSAQAPAGAGAYPYPGTTGDEDTRMDHAQPPIMSDRAPSSEQDIPPQPVRQPAVREDTPLHGVPLVGLPVWQEAAQAAAPPAPAGEHQAGYEPQRPNRGYEPDREYGQQRYDPPGYEAPWDQPTWSEPARYGRPSHGEAGTVPSAVPARPGLAEPIGPGPAGVSEADIERESRRDVRPSTADSDRWPEPDADRGAEPDADRWPGPTGVPRSDLDAEAPAGALPPAPPVEATPAPPPPGPAQPPSADLSSLGTGDRLAPASGPPSRPVRPVSGPPSRPVRAAAGQPSTSERLVGPAALAPPPPRPVAPDPVASAPPVSSGPPVTSAPPHSSPPVASAPPVTSGPPVASASSSTPAPPVEPLPEEPVPPAAPESSAPPAAPESDPRPVSAPPSKHTSQVPPVPPGLRPSALVRPGPSPAGGAQPGPEPRPRGESPAEALPQRVPAEPDVPTVPEPQAEEPPAQAPELARIWSHLRREDVPPRPEGFDVTAVLEAVQKVPGVREAKLRSNPGGGHNLRLELADGADAAQVSRKVTQLLQEQMGLSASPREVSSADSAPAASPRPAPETGRGRRRSQSRAESAARGRPQFEPAVPLQRAATTTLPAERSMPTPGPLIPRERPGPRVLIDQVQLTTYGLDATVEVRLNAGPRRSVGLSSGPAADGYLLRLTADAAVKAVNQLLRAEMGVNEPRGQCYLEQAAVIPFGSYEVAVVVVNLACAGWVEQLSGAAMVAGDAHQSVVRAALAALNRRLEALLS